MRNSLSKCAGASAIKFQAAFHQPRETRAIDDSLRGVDAHFFQLIPPLFNRPL